MSNIVEFPSRDSARHGRPRQFRRAADLQAPRPAPVKPALSTFTQASLVALVVSLHWVVGTWLTSPRAQPVERGTGVSALESAAAATVSSSR